MEISVEMNERERERGKSGGILNRIEFERKEGFIMGGSTRGRKRNYYGVIHAEWLLHARDTEFSRFVVEGERVWKE